MTELAALNVRLTGDASGLNAAVSAARGDLASLASTANKTQAQAGRLGGAMSAVASKFSGARGQIQQVSFQLQDMAVQLAAGTNASIVFAQQGSQIASAFGPIGAIIGALAAVGLPALAYAFSSNATNATALSEAIDELAGATERFRIQAEAIRLGIDENEVLIVEELNAKMAELVAAEQRLAANRGTQDHVNTLRAEVGALEEQLQKYRQRRDEAEQAQNAAENMADIQATIAGISISGPWNSVLGSIQAAINKANEYRSALAAAAYNSELAATGQASGPDAARTKLGGGGRFTPVVSGAGLAAPSVGGGGGGGGGGTTSQLQSEIEAMQEALMTQEQLQMESFIRQQEMLDQALQQRLITQEEYQRLMQQAQATHDFAMTQSVNKGVTDTLGALGQLFQGSKKIGAAIALANSWIAFTEVLKDPAYVGRPWARIAAAGKALAAGLNAVRNIKSASPGGSAGGGGGSGAGMGSAAQQNVQTMNFTITSDRFGFGENVIRQIAAQLNQASRNGTQIRATVS